MMKFYLFILISFSYNIMYGQQKFENNILISNEDIIINVSSNKYYIKKNDSLIIKITSTKCNNETLSFLSEKQYDLFHYSNILVDCGFLLYDNFTNYLIKLRDLKEDPIIIELKFSYQELKSKLLSNYIDITIAIGYLLKKDIDKQKIDFEENLYYLMFNDYILNYKKLPIVNIKYEIE